MSIVYFGLGSNIGDRKKNIHDAVVMLQAQGIATIKLSTIIETDPVGGPPQGLFLNAVLKASTTLAPLGVLNVVRVVEANLGRVRTEKDGPRTIDVDILLYDNEVIDTPELVIPHPRMYQREFVMVPLREIEPGWTISSGQGS